MTLQRIVVGMETEKMFKLIRFSAFGIADLEAIVSVALIRFGSNGAFGSLIDSIPACGATSHEKAEKRPRGSEFICAVAVAPASGCVQIESEHAIPALAVFVSGVELARKIRISHGINISCLLVSASVLNPHYGILFINRARIIAFKHRFFSLYYLFSATPVSGCVSRSAMRCGEPFRFPCAVRRG